MALHEQCVGATDEWYTPPEIFDALGMRFAVDVAAPSREVRPVLDPCSWIPTSQFISGGSLNPGTSWGSGPVWMNPPFGPRNGLVPWLEKFVAHGNGIALVPDRTSAPWFQDFAPRMDRLLFTRGKVKFIDVRGQRGDSPAQGTCLMALGYDGARALQRAAASGLGFCTHGLIQAKPG